MEASQVDAGSSGCKSGLLLRRNSNELSAMRPPCDASKTAVKSNRTNPEVETAVPGVRYANRDFVEARLVLTTC